LAHSAGIVEVGEEGVARVKGWETEEVLDVGEMRHEGPALLIKTRGGETKRLDGRKPTTPPEGRTGTGS
jgi:hypothetical protein